MPELYDNTRVSSHRTCNRMYYLRHVLHITPSTSAVPLVFGSSWHEGMDIVWGEMKNVSDNAQLCEQAMTAWYKCWDENGLPRYSSEDLDLKFRTPETAQEMLYNYICQRRQFIEGVEVLSIEEPFAVPLYSDNADILYVGRLDKIFCWNNRVWVGEHKTSSAYKKAGGFRASFVDSFSPNSQVDGYLHALHMLHGDKAKGVMIDAALVYGTVHDAFMFIPIERQFSMLDAWLFETKNEIEKINQQREKLKAHESNRVVDYLPAFPKNTGACSNYNGCPYADICKTVCDPSTLEHIPLGFKREKWEPFKELHLDKIGVSEEIVT